ncbi:MAG TPA: methyltransferase domain-containing protein [Solirubrobacteraceae bacterium]|nr:methyltransferase domain-containing protein [Solirubrobacteraceae bacterium]
MSLHPLAEGFASVADSYDRGRPDYTPAAIGALMAELRLQPGSAVLDLAAGTGKLTRALLAADLDVLAVEPQGPLRDRLVANVGPERVREGLAEAIPLPSAAVDAVTVADAFHWFDQAAALAEIARVLVPGGGLAVIATVPDWSGASWAHEVGSLLAELRPEHPSFDGRPWQDAVRASNRWSEPRELHVTSTQPASPERVLDHVASISWMAALPEDERADAIAQVRVLVEEGQTPSELSVHFVLGLTELA